MHRTIKAFLPGMLAKGRGSIINIASTVGRQQGGAQPLRLWRHQGRRGRPHQGGGDGLHRQGHPLQLHLPRHHPDAVADERIKALGKQVGGEEKARAMFIERQPMGRLGTAEEMAHVAVYLASDEFDYMTGSSITPDGGSVATLRLCHPGARHGIHRLARACGALDPGHKARDDR